MQSVIADGQNLKSPIRYRKMVRAEKWHGEERLRWKVKLLFLRRDGIDDAGLEQRLAAEAARLESATTAPLSFCRGYAIADEELLHIAAGGFDAADRPFDAMMEVIVPEPALDEVINLLAGLGERLTDIVDPEASSVLVGTEHVILPGSGPIMVLIANRRLPHFTHDGFLDYWLNSHGPFTRKHTPREIGFRYRQFHADAAATVRALAATGLAVGDFDGAAECFYPSAQSVRALMARTEIVDQATEDELKFVDHDRCVTSVFAISEAVGPAKD